MAGISAIRYCAAALALMALAGCGGTLKLLGLKHESRPAIAVRPIGGTVPPSADGATRQGREDLLAGRTGAAIEQFQRALAGGEPIGPAANGMGVAYARLGQFDQARRFFSEAIAVEPENGKYLANLARLMRSPLLMERHEADVAIALPPRPETTAMPRATGLTRVSRGEVSLRTAPSAPAGHAAPGALAMNSRLAGFKPLIRIEFSDRAGQDAAHGADEAADPDAGSAPSKPDQPTPPAAAPRSTGRVVHFLAVSRRFKPLVRVELESH